MPRASCYADDGLSPTPPLVRRFLLQAGRKAGFSFVMGAVERQLRLLTKGNPQIFVINSVELLTALQAATFVVSPG